jgi:hypothetical protein
VSAALLWLLLGLALAPMALLDMYIAAPAWLLFGWGVLVAALAAPFLGRRSLLFRLAFALAIVAALAAVYSAPWNSRKSFLMDFRRIEPGMTTAEVDRLMAPYLVGTGWPDPGNAHAEFAIDSARVYRHSTTGEYNSDWGIVHHNGGRVTKTEFSAD